LSDNNRSRAARLLGLTRDQIRYRLNKLELDSTGDGE
jgi:DNA-binding protein Fis